jgi:hypothetical protein
LAFAGAIVIGASGGALPIAGVSPHAAATHASAAVTGENVALSHRGSWTEKKKDGQRALPPAPLLVP